MQAEFSVEVDHARDLVRLRMTGFFAPADVERFDSARQHAHAHLRCARGEHRTLCDVSDMKIQAQEVVAAFSRMAADPRFVSRKLAFVTGSSLARLQAQRVPQEGRENVRFFKDVGEAERWLLA